MRRGNLPGRGHDKVTWKRSRDLLTRSCDNVTPRHGGDVTQRRYWVFCSGVTGDVVETQRLTNGTSRICITEMSFWRTTEKSLDVSFETCLRRRGDVLMGRRYYVLLKRRYYVPIRRCGDVLLKRLGDLPPRSRWVFHLRHTCNVYGTCKEMSLQRRHGILLLGGR